MAGSPARLPFPVADVAMLTALGDSPPAATAGVDEHMTRPRPRTPAAAKRKGEHWPSGAPSAARTVPRCDSQTRAGGSAVVKRDLLVGYSIADGLEPSPPELRRCPFPCQHVIGRRVDDENGTLKWPLTSSPNHWQHAA